MSFCTPPVASIFRFGWDLRRFHLKSRHLPPPKSMSEMRRFRQIWKQKIRGFQMNSSHLSCPGWCSAPEMRRFCPPGKNASISLWPARWTQYRGSLLLHRVCKAFHGFLAYNNLQNQLSDHRFCSSTGLRQFHFVELAIAPINEDQWFVAQELHTDLPFAWSWQHGQRRRPCGAGSA